MKNRSWMLVLLFAVLLYSCTTREVITTQKNRKSSFYYAVPIDAKEGILSNGVFNKERYPILGMSFWEGFEGSAAQQKGPFTFYVLIADDGGTFYSVKMPQLRIVERGENGFNSFRPFYVSINGTGFRKKTAYQVIGISSYTSERGVEDPLFLLINDEGMLDWISMTACEFVGLVVD